MTQIGGEVAGTMRQPDVSLPDGLYSTETAVVWPQARICGNLQGVWQASRAE